MQHPGCVIVGAGPAGAILALLLAREGVSVTLLEAARDFDRDFRGDTIHPSVMDLLDTLGLADRLHRIPHGKIHRMVARSGSEAATVADFSLLKVRYPYIMTLPQSRFLELVTAEAERFPNFRLMMRVRVDGLIEEDGTVRGVRFHAPDGPGERRAALTVGADGRASRVRVASGLKAVGTSPPMDVLWFRIARRPRDASSDLAGIRIGRGRLLVVLERHDAWQLGYVIPKGGVRDLRAAGLESLRESIAGLAPEFGDRVGSLSDWKQIAILSVKSDRVTRWHRPGLLLIGDAAHVMSPVGGVGINYAIQDAAVAARVLAGPLRCGRVALRDLAEVQRRRERPTRFIQFVQRIIQRRLIAPALFGEGPARLPTPLRVIDRLPVLQRLTARILGTGLERRGSVQASR